MTRIIIGTAFLCNAICNSVCAEGAPPVDGDFPHLLHHLAPTERTQSDSRSLRPIQSSEGSGNDEHYLRHGPPLRDVALLRQPFLYGWFNEYFRRELNKLIFGAILTAGYCVLLLVKLLTIMERRRHRISSANAYPSAADDTKTMWTLRQSKLMSRISIHLSL